MRVADLGQAASSPLLCDGLRSRGRHWPCRAAMIGRDEPGENPLSASPCEIELGRPRARGPRLAARAARPAKHHRTRRPRTLERDLAVTDPLLVGAAGARDTRRRAARARHRGRDPDRRRPLRRRRGATDRAPTGGWRVGSLGDADRAQPRPRGSRRSPRRPHFGGTASDGRTGDVRAGRESGRYSRRRRSRASTVSRHAGAG